MQQISSSSRFISWKLCLNETEMLVRPNVDPTPKIKHLRYIDTSFCTQRLKTDSN